MNVWRNKLLAFLHDPPHKPFDVAGHEQARGAMVRHLQLSEKEMEAWRKQADGLASAADRYPFPAAGALTVDWKREGGLQFHHPLAGTRFTPSAQPREKSAVGEAWLEEALHGLNFEGADDRARLFRLWRFWAERAAREKNDVLAYLPADSRIPDHTIWQHLAVCSALEGTGERPAFLIMQIGPVQEFIAQSRKMQDLWSGSYLLSFLIAKALAAVALEVGPDAVIYPNLRGVPLMDWAWSQVPGLFPADTFESGRGRLHPDELLVPSLPNRFLALVPGGEEGRRIAALAEKSIRDEWRRIATSVHEGICSKLGDALRSGAVRADWDKVWEAQISRFPVIEHVLHEWEADAVVKAAKHDTPPLPGGWANHPLHHAARWREIIGDSKHATENPGSWWALHYAAADWKMAAAKAARAFAPWGCDCASEKDNLNGRDEILGGADPAGFWTSLREAYRDEERRDFKGNQRYGALSVIKRLWARCYLGGKLGWTQTRPRFDSVQDIAQAIDAEEDTDKYYAILCMDGDDMGQWVAGVKAPPLKAALADKAAAYFAEHWKGEPSAEQVLRPLSPSYHAALSEALGNFSLYAAGPVVRAFGGQLFYAGGDDVLAVLPAQRALDCAAALKCAFQGQVPAEAPAAVRETLAGLFDLQDGFLRCRDHAGTSEHLRPNWPLLVPGPRATVSIGIAIGHVRSPMQDVIQAARDAERRAKGVPDKAAVCLRVLKRSGESAEFAARLDSGVAAVWEEFSAGLHGFSGRFAYRYLQLLKPLLAAPGGGWQSTWSADLVAACTAELRHTLTRQSGLKSDKAAALAADWMDKLTGPAGPAGAPALSPGGFIHFWMSWAFVHRITS